MATQERIEGQRDGNQELTRRSQEAQGLVGRRRGASLFSPFSVMRRMFDDMEQLVSAIGGVPGSMANLQPGTSTGTARGGAFELLWMPQVDASQRGDRLVVRADLPGLGLDDVEVTILDNALVIEGERRAEAEEAEGDIYRAERIYGRFRRVIPLPRGTTAEEAEARFVNGVLEVSLRLPAQPAERGERIQVQGGEVEPPGAPSQGQATH